jgi:hypothetical protein
MTGMSRIQTWLAAALLACLAPLGAAALAAPPFAPLAHSAQATLETASTPTELTLRLQPAQGTTALAVTDLVVSIDGKDAPVTPRGDNTWSVPWPPGAAARGAKLDVLVSHDGIREVLTGTLAPSAAGGAGAAADGGRLSVLRDHKQLAWWILNITVVLIAAVAISRRTS